MNRTLTITIAYASRTYSVTEAVPETVDSDELVAMLLLLSTGAGWSRESVLQAMADIAEKELP